jgi:hypothetical protein
VGSIFYDIRLFLLSGTQLPLRHPSGVAPDGSWNALVEHDQSFWFDMAFGIFDETGD